MELDGVPTATLARIDQDRSSAPNCTGGWRCRSWRWCWALIAVPLARLRPRQGRYARVGYAILIFFVYIELAIAGKMWIVRGVTPEWLGLWWVHGAVVLFAATLLLVPALARASALSPQHGAWRRARDGRP